VYEIGAILVDSEVALPADHHHKPTSDSTVSRNTAAPDNLHIDQEALYRRAQLAVLTGQYF
jgi:hypothetical protein